MNNQNGSFCSDVKETVALSLFLTCAFAACGQEISEPEEQQQTEALAEATTGAEVETSAVVELNDVLNDATPIVLSSQEFRSSGQTVIERRTKSGAGVLKITVEGSSARSEADVLGANSKLTIDMNQWVPFGVDNDGAPRIVTQDEVAGYLLSSNRAVCGNTKLILQSDEYPDVVIGLEYVQSIDAASSSSTVALSLCALFPSNCELGKECDAEFFTGFCDLNHYSTPYPCYKDGEWQICYKNWRQCFCNLVDKNPYVQVAPFDGHKL